MPFLVGEKLIFHHFPKTGGKWIGEALAASEVPFKRVRGFSGHIPPDELPPEVGRGRTPFCVVRKPEAWFPSYFRFLNLRCGKAGWVSHHLGRACLYAPSFQEFIENYLQKWPGYLSGHFARFSKVCSPDVLHQENLIVELMTLLRRSRVPFNEALLRAAPRENVSEGEDENVLRKKGCVSRKVICEYVPGQIERIRRAESWVYEKFYKEGKR